jgi:hypothetical protein
MITKGVVLLSILIYFAKFSRCSLLLFIYVKIKGFPFDAAYYLAASAKFSYNSVESAPLNKTAPSFLDENISPIVLSSNGTNKGL